MNPLLVLLSACAAVVVLASPHHIARHNALAARVALAIPDDTLPLHRRQSSRRRCRPQSSSSESLPPTPTVISPSSQNPSPIPTTSPASQNPSPIPTTNNLPTTSTTLTPEPTTTPNSNLPSSTSGDGTYYSTGLGACGITSNDGEFIAALSHAAFDPFTPDGNPNRNSLCNKRIRVTFGGNTITVVAVDRCEACKYGDLDFSPTAFQALSPMTVGRIQGIAWAFID